jgi:hypothetical protein
VGRGKYAYLIFERGIKEKTRIALKGFVIPDDPVFVGRDREYKYVF